MSIEISRANLDYIYVTTYESWWGDKKIWRTNNGGTTWAEITPPSVLLNGELWVPYDIAVSAADENTYLGGENFSIREIPIWMTE